MNELREFLSQPLAMELRAAEQFITSMASTKTPEPKEHPKPYVVGSDMRGWGVVEADAANGTRNPQSLVAVVPLFGPLSMHGGWFSQSTKQFTSDLQRLDANPAIGTIVSHVNSPGGTVSGTIEAADAMRSIKTRTITVIEPMMASAATWIGTTADEVVITPSGEGGSIGVIAMYADQSGALEKLGVKVDVVRTPDLKARYTGWEPMTDEMRADLERQVDADYQQFLQVMSTNRGVSVAEVIERFGGGKMLSAAESVAAGLVDRIGTLDQVLSELMPTDKGDTARRRRNQNRLLLTGALLEV